jgi:hypothetical protein
MTLTGKEKAVVGSVIALLVGLANVLVPFITDSAVLHYITIGLAVVGFLGVYFGVYQTTNSVPATPDHSADETTATVPVPDESPAP